jgi:peptide/nickel transport system substrate-binding protein
MLPLATAAVVASALAAYPGGAGSSVAPTLVVDNSFVMKTSDPQRAYEPTSFAVDRAIYDTLFTFERGDLAHPIPLLVKSWKAGNGATSFTFRLEKNVYFADGTPLTSADVVFSLRRLVNLKGSPAFLLAGVTVSAKGRDAVVMRSRTPMPQLPSILAAPPTAIINSKLVEAHGGTDAANAATADKAEQWFNSSASAGAGSGPYTLKSYSATSQIVLTASKRYWGSKKPRFGSVVFRNMPAATQLLNVARGSHEIAIDLSSQQAQTLAGNHKLRVSLQPSTWVFYLVSNDDPQISTVTPNKQFQRAVRYGLDYEGIVSVAGPGAIQAAGVIPSMLLGSLPKKLAIEQNLAKARAALAASGVANEQVTLEYPSDLTLNGVSFATLAQKVQASLQSAGIDVTLSGSPIASWLPRWRDGKLAFALSAATFDYPDPGDYLVFTPGELIGNHAGWPKGSDPAIEQLAAKALFTTAPTARKSLYQQLQLQLNERGPFFPLMQPAQVFVATADLRNAVFDAVYQVDVTQVSST